MLSYYFPPVKAIGSIRNKNVADSFLENGYDVTVFSSDPLASDETIEVIGLCPFDLRYFLTRRISKNSGANTPSSRQWASKIMNSFPGNLLFGEGGLIYTWRVLRRLWKFRNNDVIIYSSFRPIADHHIAYLFKKINPKSYWIADYRDVLYDKDVIDVYFPGLQTWIYKRLTQNADVLTTVSKGLTSSFTGFNNELAVLRNGIQQNKTDISQEDRLLNSGKFHISYTGALYAGRRDPSMLFMALSKLISERNELSNRIQLNYAGRESSVWNELVNSYGLEDINNDLGMLTRPQAIALQADSNINLLLSWSSPNNKGILTGKFYEYLDAQNSILCILSGSKDEEFEEIFGRDKIGLLAYEGGEEAIQNFIKSMLEFENEDKYISEEVIKKYLWKAGFDQFIKTLRN